MIGSTAAQDVDIDGVYGDNKGSGAPTTTTFRLYIGDPTTTGVECTGTGYAGIAVANTTAAMGASSGGQLGPLHLDYGTAGAGDWGTPTHVANDDGSGHLYDVLEIASPTLINNGDPVTVDVVIGY